MSARNKDGDKADRERYILEVRSQHSRGAGNGRFGGPDTYVAVQIVPPGVEPLRVLNRKVAARRGIKIVYFGDGYSQHKGPRSLLGQAIVAAKAFIIEQIETPC